MVVEELQGVQRRYSSAITQLLCFKFSLRLFNEVLAQTERLRTGMQMLAAWLGVPDVDGVLRRLESKSEKLKELDE